MTFHGLILINIYLIWCKNALVPLKCQILKCWHFLGKSKDLNELIRKGLATQRFQCKRQFWFVFADKKVVPEDGWIFFSSVPGWPSTGRLISHVLSHARELTIFSTMILFYISNQTTSSYSSVKFLRTEICHIHLFEHCLKICMTRSRPSVPIS